MADYGDYCPVNMAAEVLAGRWTPLIIRELVLGSTRFNEVARVLPGISRTLLAQRLRHLERHGIVETWPSPAGRVHEYRLTQSGHDLEAVIDAMGRWAIEWLFDDLRPETVPPTTLMWWMHRRIRPEHFPPQRTVIEFRFLDAHQTIWLLLDRGAASVCAHHPGFDSDVVASARTGTFAAVFRGVSGWRQAVLAGDIEVEGMPRLTRALPTWFAWSPWADVTRARARRGPTVRGASGDRVG